MQQLLGNQMAEILFGQSLFIITVAVLNHYTTDICATDNVLSELRCKYFFNSVQHPLLRLLLKVPQWQARLSYSRLPCSNRMFICLMVHDLMCMQSCEATRGKQPDRHFK